VVLMADTEARDVHEPDPDAPVAGDQGATVAAEPEAPWGTGMPEDSPALEGTGADATEEHERGKHEASRRQRVLGSTPFLILVALGVAILVKTFFVQAFYIPSESMVPTLEVGDRVFVNKLVYDIGDIGRGDVIVFENPHPSELPDRGVIDGFIHWLGEGIGFAQPENEDFIKRVVGLPGEEIEIRDDVVYIDGEAIDEPYLTDESRGRNGDYPLTEIQPGTVFVMGDNRGNSADSRYGLGFVPLDKVIGEAFVVIWPPSHVGGLD
jgi:signal peptidase I